MSNQEKQNIIDIIEIMQNLTDKQRERLLGIGEGILIASQTIKQNENRG